MNTKYKYALLLCCHNTPERHKMTNDIVLYYMNEIPINRIFIVDSANNGCNLIPKKQQCIFDQNVECKITTHITETEICSLLKACNTLDFGDAEYVLKLSCKYKLPDLKSLIFTNDIAIQYRTMPLYHWQNTEFYAVHITKFKEIIYNLLELNGDMEFRMYETYNKYKYERMPVLQNYARYRRNNGSILYFL